MHVQQRCLKSINEARHPLNSSDWALVFTARSILENPENRQAIQALLPDATVLFCSTAGEIYDSEVFDNTITITAVKMEKTEVAATVLNVADYSSSYEAGRELTGMLVKESLRHIFLLADGQLVNGSELVRGINDHLPNGATISGGLAGDGADFKKTLVGLNDDVREGNITALAFYGRNLKIGHGSNGGWDSFGPDRLITRSHNNVLYELDGKSALDLYKQYLGDLAQGLPGTALLFPLSIRISADSEPVVRTILSIDENEKSMTFAGDMPEGAYARLMKSNFERLIDAASQAATSSYTPLRDNPVDLAILISCVGRKLVLGQRVDEEVESVRDILGANVPVTGFYSYGEISPLMKTVGCELHNQTMTITTFAEV